MPGPTRNGHRFRGRLVALLILVVAACTAILAFSWFGHTQDVPERKTIAVLSFAKVGEDQDQEYSRWGLPKTYSPIFPRSAR
jgi:hypothetical protein